MPVTIVSKTAIPKALKDLGFTSKADMTAKLRRLMVSIAGPASTGKSEFALSAPGLGAVLALDRGLEGCLMNPNPPAARNPNFAFHIIEIPKSGQSNSNEFYKEYWKKFYSTYRAILEIPEIRSVVLDGDADSYELQRLAEWGRVTKVPPIQYEAVNSARRVMYNRAYDSRKIFIATSRVKKVYETVFNPDGTPKKTDNGNDVREWNGQYEREGFRDATYLWQVHLLSKYDEEAKQFGAEIQMCKFDRSLEGLTLWGDDCNFLGLVSTIFPDVDPKEWGF